MNAEDAVAVARSTARVLRLKGSHAGITHVKLEYYHEAKALEFLADTVSRIEEVCSPSRRFRTRDRKESTIGFAGGINDARKDILAIIQEER